MNKYFYPIFKLPTFYERDYVNEELPLYVKWWLLGKAGRKLSEILTGSEFTLLHTLNKKFKILQINGRTEQEQLTGKNLFDASVVDKPAITIENNGAKILIANGEGVHGVPLGFVKNLCPNLKIGDVIKFNFNTNAVRNEIAVNYIYISNIGRIYYINRTIEVTQEVLDGELVIYAGQTANVYYNDFMIYMSTETDTSWEPYCRTEHQAQTQTLHNKLKM